MNPEKYEQFIQANAVWFRGHNPERADAIVAAENRLGVSLPESMKWLMTQYGYWKATGIAGLPCIVGATLANRPQFPDSWIILGSSNSYLASGSKKTRPAQKRYQSNVVILVVSNQHRWDGKAVFHCDSAGNIVDRFSGFTEYTIEKQRELARNSNSQYQHCLPDFHQSLGEPLLAEKELFNQNEFQRRVQETVIYHKLQPSEETDARPQNENPITDYIAEIIQEKREYLTLHQGSLPVGCRDTSSSPRWKLQYNAKQIEGYLVILETSIDSSPLAISGRHRKQEFSLTEFEELGISHYQIVSLIRHTNTLQKQDRIILWVSKKQLTALQTMQKPGTSFPILQIVPCAEIEGFVSAIKNAA